MDKKTPITIEVELKEEDLVDFFYYTSKKSIAMKMFIAFAIILFIAQSIKLIVDPTAIYGSSGLWFLFTCFLFFMIYYTNKFNAQRTFRRDSRLRAKHIYTIDSDTIRINGGPYNATLQWSQLLDISESKKSFFIWIKKGMAQIIPKENMTPEDILFLREIKNTKFGKN